MNDKEAKIVIKSYLKDVSAKVVCTYTIKKFFMSDLKINLMTILKIINILILI